MASEGGTVKSYVRGHRARLRARYRQNGETALQDTKLLAKKLLERFGTPARASKITIYGSLKETFKVAAPGKG